MDKIKKAIDDLIELYRQNPNRWENERYSHYDFYKLLFNYYKPEEIKSNFKWEYPVGPPSYAKRNDSGYVDITFHNNEGKWFGVEIENDVGHLEVEIPKCIQKFQTNISQKHMEKGYIVPLVKVEGNKKARNKNMTYSEYISQILENTKKEIQDAPIEIVTDGIIIQ